MAQIELTEEPHKLGTPELQLGRAISDYLYTSRKAKTMYFNDSDYMIAEEKAWKKLEEAVLEHPEFKIDISKIKSEEE